MSCGDEVQSSILWFYLVNYLKKKVKWSKTEIKLKKTKKNKKQKNNKTTNNKKDIYKLKINKIK